MKTNIKRLEILEKGAEIIIIKGFNNTGINEILTAADIPKGSFYFYFKNKEDFGINLIKYFLGMFLKMANQFLNQEDLPYLTRFRGFFDFFLNIYVKQKYTGGCPIGNFSLEMSDLNENFRVEILNSFDSMQDVIKSFLIGAKNNSEISKKTNIDEMSEFILNSWEGTLMRMKVRKNSNPSDIFFNLIFEKLLKNKK